MNTKLLSLFLAVIALNPASAGVVSPLPPKKPLPLTADLDSLLRLHISAANGIGVHALRPPVPSGCCTESTVAPEARTAGARE